MLRPNSELGACVIVVALCTAGALGSGCSPTVAQSSGPAAGPTTTAADPGPLPPPEALRDVLARLADPAVAGADKLALIQNSTPADAAALDGFAVALRDTGSTPVAVNATDILWSPDHPGTVMARISIAGPDPANASSRLSFPMEFERTAGGWQLTRETADTLLVLPDPR